MRSSITPKSKTKQCKYLSLKVLLKENLPSSEPSASCFRWSSCLHAEGCWGIRGGCWGLGTTSIDSFMRDFSLSCESDSIRPTVKCLLKWELSFSVLPLEPIPWDFKVLFSPPLFLTTWGPHSLIWKLAGLDSYIIYTTVK